MNFKIKVFSVFTFVLVLIQTACIQFGKTNLPNVEAYRKEVGIVRFEHLVFDLNIQKLPEEVETLANDYPVLFDIYFDNLLGFKYEEDSIFFFRSLKGFLQDEKILQLKRVVQEEYYDISNLEKELSEAFAYMKYYFPSFEQPNVYTLFAEYTIQLFLFTEENGRDAVGIGLDMFLGRDYPYGAMFPDNPSFSTYLTRSFNREHIAKKTMEAIIQDRMTDPAQERLLDIMIHNGKKLFILDKVLPMAHDSIITEFTEDELNWCTQNELEMWAFFFKKELFYETDLSKINKYIYPSPHSPGMPEDAPGRTGNYMGWKIVEAYMRKFPETSMEDLLHFEDAQKLLELSKYKPKRM